MRSIILSAAFAAAALVLSACTNVAKFDYQAAPGTLIKLREPGSATKTIAVMPFMDQRGTPFADAGQAPAHDVGDHGSFCARKSSPIGSAATEKGLSQERSSWKWRMSKPG